jgi:hypothetical protein
MSEVRDTVRKMRILGRVHAFVALMLLPACGNVRENDTVDGGATDAAIDASGLCDPATSSTPVDDGCGVFVDATSGDDANVPSTKASPMKTLAAALAQVPDGGVVYACSGAAFDRAVTVPAGVTIRGGLDCATWAYDANVPTIVTAPNDRVPLRLAGGTATTVLADLYVQAAPAFAAGSSSIGVIVDSATARFDRVLIVTADATSGAAGSTPSDAVTPGVVGNPGAGGCTGLSIPGGATTSLTCSNGITTGGKGGDGAYYGYDGANGTTGPANFGRGHGMTPTIGCANGSVGVIGAVGGTGAPATGHGTITAQGYTGASGDLGGVGAPGQGGGGGGGASSFGNCGVNTFGGSSGGSGGTGGCGGMGGTGGRPGGSSIGILSVAATLIFSDVTITTGDGGDGGDGGAGQVGGEGGDGAAGGTTLYAACRGGKGGTGGTGGVGGGGSGGHSIGIAYLGLTAPPAAMVTFTLGAAGDGGGVGAAQGSAGVAENVQAF